MLVSHVMVSLGLSGRKVFQSIEQVRKERYKLLHGFIVGQHGAYGMSSYQGDLQPVYIPATCYAANKSIGELNLAAKGAGVHTIRRGNDTVMNPDDSTTIQAEDVVVVTGDRASIEAAEAYLLSGK
jgi:CPA2 family monovalent cation:H+ antiporter-2